MPEDDGAGLAGPESASQRRWVRRPAGSTWGDFGPDDQLGRLNLLTPRRRLAAVSEVRDGRVFALSLPLDLPGTGLVPPFRRPPQLSETAGHNARFSELFGMPGAVDIGCDDVVTLNTQYSTQWDAFCHVGALFDVDGTGDPQPVYYNGFRADVDIVGAAHADGPRALRLGIDHIAGTGVQGRGVLLDLHALYGDERVLIGAAELADAMQRQDVTVEEGDILCLHTGFAAAALSAGAQADAALLDRYPVLDGADEALLQWITDSGVAAIAADNIGVEVQPSGSTDVGVGEHTILPLHHHCLFKLGVPIGELWYLSELADWLRRAERNRFLLTAPPLRLPGAVGSPVTPVATV
ncbi:cyclase family protein [Mycobacteroides abscessus]|uniref:cyclase family protein n=1 Tax=Mycobacteroides abscessus TaxID=36809 RepID=UPI000929EE87|nr:cyclase family protein [Mycobacteroides abscessus]SHQ38996.1 cyclase superfamily protein [Mycobacteroides abscessus subsp. abscessus]